MTLIGGMIDSKMSDRLLCVDITSRVGIRRAGLATMGDQDALHAADNTVASGFD